VSAYGKKKSATSKDVAEFEEIAAPQCKPFFYQASVVLIYLFAGHFQGSIFVSIHARLFLEGT
jgi:hypothetical protein